MLQNWRKLFQACQDQEGGVWEQGISNDLDKSLIGWLYECISQNKVEHFQCNQMCLSYF